MTTLLLPYIGKQSTILAKVANSDMGCDFVILLGLLSECSLT